MREIKRLEEEREVLNKATRFFAGRKQADLGLSKNMGPSCRPISCPESWRPRGTRFWTSCTPTATCAVFTASPASTAAPSSTCATPRERKPTLPDERQKAKPDAKSYAASSDTFRTKYTAPVRIIGPGKRCLTSTGPSMPLSRVSSNADGRACLAAGPRPPARRAARCSDRCHLRPPGRPARQGKGQSSAWRQ